MCIMLHKYLKYTLFFSAMVQSLPNFKSTHFQCFRPQYRFGVGWHIWTIQIPPRKVKEKRQRREGQKGQAPIYCLWHFYQSLWQSLIFTESVSKTSGSLLTYVSHSSPCHSTNVHAHTLWQAAATELTWSRKEQMRNRLDVLDKVN